MMPVSECCGVLFLAKLGTALVVCSFCDTEYFLTPIKRHGLDAVFTAEKQKLQKKKVEKLR